MSRIETLRDALGGAHPLAVNKVKDHLEPFVQGYIGQSPFVVMASANANGDCDASPKGGLPGFVKVLDERRLLFPDVGGNRLFQSFENFESNPKLGLVFMIPGFDVTVRVNGRVEVRDRESLAADGFTSEVSNPDDNAALVQGVVVHVDEAYFHCPRAFQFGKVWDTETIEANAQRSLKSLME